MTDRLDHAARRRGPWLGSVAILGLMIAASLGGLLIDDLYVDGPNVAAALRGGDVATLTVAAPVLAIALWRVRQGSVRAHLVWLGMLAYALYTYAYHAFGPTFNALFLVHVAIYSSSFVALGFGFGALDPTTMRDRFRSARPHRILGGLLVVVAVFLVLAYGLASLRYTAGGEPPTDVLPFAPWRVHLGYALDLSLSTPAALISGVLLWRRTAWGYAAATTTFVFLAVYQLDFLGAAVFMDAAGIAGAAESIPRAATMAAVFFVPAGLLLWGVDARVVTPPPAAPASS